MIEYYPEVIQKILEFQAIIDGEAPEIEALSDGVERVTTGAYLTTMSEERTVQWEHLLGIQPLLDSTLDQRRDTIIARIRGTGKLNTELINLIVYTFTGGTAKSFVNNGTLYIRITPPPENKQYQFKDVEQEIMRKVPAHLRCEITRNYYTWNDVKNDYSTWETLSTEQDSWNSVLLLITD